ncbi:hypothetical protein KIW84_076001 [Lathyrus oleraceus]|uniref:Retroviral polymerase SH3-like domain-containing protein n=1 Tax=Pisum sativum TaxID=3888 RepID=A0A9D5A1T5_PEA|nr:hypothetical protein KIW84_076001 [Pisum sativum]
MATSNVVSNVYHTSQEENSSIGAYSFHHGRRRFNHGRGRNTTVNRPTCQLCGKYRHSVTTCWYRFDENFMPSSTSSTSANPAKTSNSTRESTQETSHGSQTMAMTATTSRLYAYTQEYSLPSELESQAWFTDSDRLPTSSLTKVDSPFHALYGKQPDYTSLKVFRCSCFPLLRPYNKHKFQLRSQECVYLGVSSKHREFKCLSKKGKIFISKDFTFNEGSFPFPKLFVKESMPSNSHTTNYNYGSTSAPFMPIIVSLVHIPTISLKSLLVTNDIVSSHSIVPNYTDQSPLNDKNTNQKSDHLGFVLSPNRLISESRSSHSATAPYVISQSSNTLNLVNVLVSNHSHELSNSSFSSTTPIVFSYPKDNTHIELSIQNNNPEGHIYDSNWGLSNYPEGSNQLEYLTSSAHNPEENVCEQQTKTQ